MRRQPSKLVGVVRQRIRQLRLERGLTQEELCERAGISVDAISRIEGGTRIPTLTTLEHIAQALGVAPVAFLEGVAAPATSPRPAPLRRVVTLLEREPEALIFIAEDAVSAVIRAYRGGTGTRRRRRPKRP
jgi:transcriptional regulator with XRE-family HTH domain